MKIIMKAPLLLRGCTSVTLTVKELCKFCVLFYLFHCTHHRFYNTLSAQEALVSVESTALQIIFTSVSWNLIDKKIFSFHFQISVQLIFLKQLYILLYYCISSFAEVKEYRLKIRKDFDSHVNSLGTPTCGSRVEILSS